MNKLYFNLSNLSTFIGTFVFIYVIQIWLIEISSTPDLYANTLAISLVPVAILSLFSGVIVDRFNKKTVSIISDVSNGVICLVMFILINDSNKVIIVTITLVCLKVLDVFYSVSMKSLIKEIFTDKNEITDVNAAYTFLKQAATMLSPLIGSILLIFISYRLFFLINGISYLTSAFFTSSIKHNITVVKNNNSYLTDMKKSFKYLYSNKKLIKKIITIVFANIFLVSETIYIPYIILDKLQLNSFYLSLVLIVCGLGALFSLLLIKLFNVLSFEPNEFILLFAGVAVFLFAYPNVYILAIILFIHNALISVFNIYFFTSVTTMTDDKYIGRVNGYIYFFAMISQPIGIFIWGNISYFYSSYALILISIVGVIFMLLLYFINYLVSIFYKV